MMEFSGGGAVCAQMIRRVGGRFHDMGRRCWFTQIASAR